MLVVLMFCSLDNTDERKLHECKCMQYMERRKSELHKSPALHRLKYVRVSAVIEWTTVYWLIDWLIDIDVARLPYVLNIALSLV